MLNLISVANRKKTKANKVDHNYNKKFSLARLNLEVLNQEEKCLSIRELLDSVTA